MEPGFDFTTEEVLAWEVDAIFAAIDRDELRISKHASNEASLDGLTDEDVYDVINFFDDVTKDLPGNALGRAPGLNFERDLGSVRVLAKVGWRDAYYIVVTVVAQ